MNRASLPEFNILDWLDRLQPAGRAKSRYICPNCGGNNLSINLRSGKYRCYSGCENSEVREAIRPLKEALQEAGISPDDYQAQREERIREREARSEQREREERSRQAKLLSLEERDRQFRLLHRQAGYPGSKHVRDLIERRKLHKSEIDFAAQKGWLWTWQGGNDQPFGTTSDLPGVDPRKGKLRFFSGASGFAIAALDPDGKVTGLQIANDNRNPKYQWISSASVGGNGPALPNGELPLFCWKYPQTNNIAEAWLCEGAVKSLLVALFLWRMGRTDIAVIGTASAAQYGEQTLRDYLERLGANSIKLMPDAGAIANRQIHSANKSTLELCSSWGYQVSVGWWEQSSKEELDVDELLASGGSCDRFLSAEEYLNLRQLPQKEKRAREISKAEWVGLNAWRSFQSLFAQIKQKASANAKPIENKAKECTAIVKYTGPKEIDYVPGQLPTFDEWKAADYPIINFAPGQRKQISLEAYHKQYANVLDSSLMGTGKSHESGELTREDFGLIDFDEEEGEDNGGRIVHLMKEALNPTTRSIEENSEALIRRHLGETEDLSRLTPLGNPYRTRTPKGQQSDIPANCPETNTFLKALEEKGIFIHGGEDSPICQRCPLYNGCEFLATRREQLKRRVNLRAHPNQIGSAASGKDIAIVDEPGTLLEASKTITVKRQDISLLFGVLRSRDRQTYNLLYKFLCLISDGLGNALDIGIPRHGLTHTQTLAWLGKCWGTTEEDKFQTKIWEIYQSFGEYYEHPTAVKLRKTLEEMAADNDDPWSIPTIEDLKQQVQKALTNDWDKTFEGRQTPEQKQEAIDAYVTLNFVNYFIEAITGENKYLDIRITEDGKYLITRRSKQHEFTLSRFKFRLFLDSTTSIWDLRKKTGQKHILQIRQKVEPDAFNNLNIKIVKGLGTNPKGTTASTTIARYLAAVQGAIAQTGLENEQVALITSKTDLEIFKDIDIQKGYWHRDSRGNNRFSNINQLILHGLPKPNLGDMAAQWHALTGESVTPTDLSGKYGYWYRQQVMAEVIQALGRPRAHLRPSDRIEVTILAGDALSVSDIAALQREFPGCKVEVVDAHDLAPEAAAKGVRQQHRAIEVALEMIKDGVKPKLEAIAKQLNLTKGRASQIFNALHSGGFRAILKSLTFLYRAIEGKLNFSELDEETQYFARTLLPLFAKDLEITASAEDPTPKHLDDVVASVVAVFETTDAKQVRRILAHTPRWALGKLFGAFMQVGLKLLDNSPPVAIAHSSGG